MFRMVYFRPPEPFHLLECCTGELEPPSIEPEARAVAICHPTESRYIVSQSSKAIFTFTHRLFDLLTLRHVLIKDRNATVAAGGEPDLEPALPGHVVVLELDGNALFHRTPVVGLEFSAFQVAEDIPKVPSTQLRPRHVQSPFGFDIHVREPPVPVECEKGVADTFKNCGTAFASGLGFSAQRTFVFGGFAAQAAHGKVRPDPGKEFSGGKRLNHVVVGASLQAFNTRVFPCAGREQ